MGDEDGTLRLPQPPIPIFRLSAAIDRYMLYDVEIVSWLRRKHHILGVLTGSLPLVPQQNVFLGLPLELMPEEARLLVDDGIAYVVDDAIDHRTMALTLKEATLHKYMENLLIEGCEAASIASQQKAERTANALARKANGVSETTAIEQRTNQLGPVSAEVEESTVTENAQAHSAAGTLPRLQEAWAVTPPTVSVLISQPKPSTAPQPDVDAASYAVFRHLNSRGYYLSPGLRFGCQFMVYPGDPLRYHSHFLCVSAEWEEEIELLDILAGGRLGTGVKKGFLVGGSPPEERGRKSGVRTFCIEWAGM